MAKFKTALSHGRHAQTDEADGWWWENPKTLARAAVDRALDEVIAALMERAASDKKLRGRLQKGLAAASVGAGRGAGRTPAWMIMMAVGFYDALRNSGCRSEVALHEVGKRFSKSPVTVRNWVSRARTHRK